MDWAFLESKLLADGVAQVGYCCVADSVPERYNRFPNAVVLVCRLLDGVMDEVAELEEATFAYFHHYRTVNAFLDRCALWAAQQIEQAGYHAMPVGASQSVKDMGEYTGIFSHKTAAVKAGLGWIGRSALFVSPLYGPRVRLVTVLTDMPLAQVQPSKPNSSKFGCGSCRLCVDKCPAGAIQGPCYVPGMSRRRDVLDVQACSEYMKKRFRLVGRGAVCGICVSVCPFGRQNK